MRQYAVIISNEANICETLRAFFADESLELRLVKKLEEVKQLSNSYKTEIRLILVDAFTTKTSHIDEWIKESQIPIPVVFFSSYTHMERFIKTSRRGALSYLLERKAFNSPEPDSTQSITYNNHKMKSCKPSLPNIVGSSDSLKNVFDIVQCVSQSSSTVLIQGESGTGKELIAHAIHDNGPRSNKPFLAINCSAIPEGLMESELFGHAKGAFTGASQNRLGIFEEAEGGTIFLDEIGEMPLVLQAKLLRAVQEKKIRPVGKNIDKSIDVRVIAATNKNLKVAVKNGEFREDLYFRLSVIPINLPPLRQRCEDISILAKHFLEKFSALNNINIRGFTQEAFDKLMQQRWEGNIRELENTIERIVVLSKKTIIDADDIPSNDSIPAESFFGDSTEDTPTLEQLEKRYIKLVLEQTGQQIERAANILGINRRTLYRKQHSLGLISGRQLHLPHETDDEKKHKA